MELHLHDFLRDNIWGFVGVVVAIIVGIAPILRSFRRIKKTIEYKILSRASVLNVDGPLRNRLTILFDDQRIRHPNLYVMELVNVGNASISRKDFDGAIEIDFHEGKIISIDFNSDGVIIANVDHKIGDHVLSILPRLFNRKEDLIIKAMVSDAWEEPTVRGKIENGEIKKKVEKHRATRTPYFVGMRAGFITTAVMTSVTSIILKEWDYSWRGLALAVTALLISLWLCCYLILKFEKVSEQL